MVRLVIILSIICVLIFFNNTIILLARHKHNNEVLSCLLTILILLINVKLSYVYYNFILYIIFITCSILCTLRIKAINILTVSAWLVIGVNIFLLSFPDDILLQSWSQKGIAWRKLE